MRTSANQSGIKALAIAGTYVVMVGWDIVDESLKNGLLGFAIRRTDHAAGEIYWLRGMKAFPNTQPPLGPGQDAATNQQPIQSFQWADYTAKPQTKYSYELVPMYGAPGALKSGASVLLDITTESEWGGTHSVFFNRAAIASQEYARRFHDQAPDQVGPAAYAWLSRGLIEAIIAFIGRAVSQRFGLRIAIYEFQWPNVLNAVKAAAARGVDVQVLYDAIDNPKGDPVHPNEEAIDTAGIQNVCTGITQGKIMHNKFIVLLENGNPIEVLTGSTNYTENGLFGHLNCAHIVNDSDVAQAYLKYWAELQQDLPLATLRPWNDSNRPAPPSKPKAGTYEVYSPQTGTGTLNRYGQIAASAQNALFMTFAFGMNNVFLSTYLKKDGVLRFALMDKVGVGKGIAAAQANIDNVRATGNAIVAIGQSIALNQFDRWVKERDGLATKENVRWVHTKFMLVDPLSSDPIVITGSANFSDASISENHENVLVIRGDTRVADIYLTEFMRQFSSYAFRDATAEAAKTPGSTFKPQDLVPDASWLTRYFVAGTTSSLRRIYFAG